MAIPLIPPAIEPANENLSASVTIIPTLFARLHADVLACDNRDELVDASLRFNKEMWNVSPWAHRAINRAIGIRHAELEALHG